MFWFNSHIGVILNNFISSLAWLHREEEMNVDLTHKFNNE